MNIHGHTEPGRRPQAVLLTVAVITAATFAGELWGGLLSGSLALLSDATHVFMDLTGLLFSLFALRLAERPVTDRRTFGLHRLEVVAAFLNGLLILAAAAGILWESVDRLKHPRPSHAGTMILWGILGFLMNVLAGWMLHDFAKKDINIRSAFLHAATDALASIGVLAGGLLIRATGSLRADPVVSLLISLAILASAGRVLKDAVNIFLEGAPPNIDLRTVVEDLAAVPGVADVEDAHLWSLCSHVTSFSAHIRLDEGGWTDQRALLRKIEALLSDRFHIHHATLQLESAAWEKPGDRTRSER